MVTVALPIETKVRELYGKLWLGNSLLSRNHEVVIGPSWEVSNTLHRTEPDIYITKDPGNGNIDFINRLRSTGIQVWGIDTEGGLNSINKWVKNKKSEVLNHIDGYFCWGKRQYDALSSWYNTEKKLFITGAPRFDLLQKRFRQLYKSSPSSIINRIGDFILINTSFGIANAFNKELNKSGFERVHGGLDQSMIRRDFRNLHAFLEVIPHIGDSFPEHTIVVRPHPGENQETYRNHFNQLNDIQVHPEGDVRKWIAAADTVIHHDCTTGVESVLMETPTISYRPIDMKGQESNLPQKVSTEVFDREDLIDKIKKYGENGPNMYSKRDILGEYFHNVKTCAAEAITDVIDEIELNKRKHYDQLKPSVWRAFELYIKASRWSKQAIRCYDSIRYITGDNLSVATRNKRKQKFPGVSTNEINKVLDAMNEIEKKVKQVPTTNNTYIIKNCG
jgi:surface carbohydrate biosynthesis protein